MFLKNIIKTKNLKKGLPRILSRNFDKVFLSIKKDIKIKGKTLHVLDKKFKFNFKTKDLKNFKKFKSIAIIGMGGSILGAEAIYNFLGSKINKEVLFFDDLDENKIKKFKQNKKLTKILYLVISKSGNTVETLSNLFALKILKKNSKNIVIISERKNNSLLSLAQEFNLFYIEHKDYIGGRYSVLSEVGIVPAYLMGINISKLRLKTLDFISGKNQKFLKDNSIKLAQLINSNRYKNLIFLNYSSNLEKFLQWCQQLIAESLGKKNKGLLPMISNAPKDHHSLLQLYLDGPKDKIFYIFSSENKFNETLKINRDISIKNILNKKKISKIKNAQKNAVIRSLVKKNIPFREFKIRNINEEALGKLFSYFILETVAVGKMLKINPFDQPAVEQVKLDTKKLLIQKRRK